jgi:hypothetical protein
VRAVSAAGDFVCTAGEVDWWADGRFGKQDFVYLPAEDVYRCPAGEKLSYHMTTEQDGKMMRRYWTAALRAWLGCGSRRGPAFA